MHLNRVESYLIGKTPNQSAFEEAARMAQSGANPIPQTDYKVKLIFGTIMAAFEQAMEA